MLNRINQLGLTLAIFAFAGLGTAHAQDEDPCGDWEENPCEENPCEDGDDANPCDAGDDDDDGEEAGEEAHDAEPPLPAAAGAHPMVVPKGKIQLGVALGVNMSADVVGDPIVLAPDVAYGAMDKLDVGLYHSNYGLTGFWNQSAGSLCIVGDTCGDVYNGPTGILANYSVMEGQMGVSAGGGLVLSNVTGDTMLMDIKLGAKIRYAIDAKMGIIAEPALAFSINERDADVMAGSLGKRDAFVLPVAFMYAVDAKIHAGVQTGISGPLDGFGDAYRIPLNVSGMYQVDAKLGVGGMFGFMNIAGKGSDADFRNLTLFAHYTL